MWDSVHFAREHKLTSVADKIDHKFPFSLFIFLQTSKPKSDQQQQKKQQQRYSVFHRIRQTKFAHSGLILSLSKLLILTQLPPNVERNMKIVKK
jgi:hypothetical protein